MKTPLKIVLAAGARPNFMKAAPILANMKEQPGRFQPLFVHTGQHYDDSMSKSFLRDLGLPDPDAYLGAGSASHAAQTAKVMMAFEKILYSEKPDWVAVVGDVNSTLACALAAAKLHVPVAHVEAGLRSGDRGMPEEINRILTDQLSDLLFTSCADAKINCMKEGIPEKKIHFVGNVMIESLLKHQDKINRSCILKSMGLEKGLYALLTLHRPSNVDRMETAKGIFGAIAEIAGMIPVVFPVHPRTRLKIREFALADGPSPDHRLIMTEPLEYFDFHALEKNARFVMTDSGGVQEETTFYGVPCVTLRENTERPVTVAEGTNVLAGMDPEAIVRAGKAAMEGKGGKGKIPEFWDGHVSERIVDCFLEAG